MARYIVLPTIDPSGIPSYYVVDTSDNSRVRRYDCELWAEHEAMRMNGDREEERDKSLLNRLYERLFRKGGYRWTLRTRKHHTAPQRRRERGRNDQVEY